MELQKKYVGAVNCILKGLDFRRLEESCNSYEQIYAKEVLGRLHQAFVDTYGTDFLPYSVEPFVSMPAVLWGKKNGDVTLGMVVVDMTRAGELVDTVLFTSKGILDQRRDLLSSVGNQDLIQKYIPYDYWYTPELACDQRVNFDYIPARVYSLLRSCSEITPANKIPARGGI